MTSDSQTESGGVVSSTDWLACPWCKDTDFDDVGLKLHITSGHCDAFNNLSVALPVTRKANAAVQRLALEKERET